MDESCWSCLLGNLFNVGYIDVVFFGKGFIKGFYLELGRLYDFLLISIYEEWLR